MGNLFVLKSSFNPLWEDFDIKHLLATIKKSWVENLPSIVQCNLEGRCSLHNSETMQHVIPFDLRVAKIKWLNAAKFKYTLLQTCSSLTDNQTADGSGLKHKQDPLHQEPLERFWTGPHSGGQDPWKMCWTSPDLVCQVEQKGDMSSASVNYDTVMALGWNSEPSQALLDLVFTTGNPRVWWISEEIIL